MLLYKIFSPISVQFSFYSFRNNVPCEYLFSDFILNLAASDMTNQIRYSINLDSSYHNNSDINCNVITIFVAWNLKKNFFFHIKKKKEEKNFIVSLKNALKVPTSSVEWVTGGVGKVERSLTSRLIVLD